jgi:glycosyltransferase involved in cell wall biosynthesis
MKIAQVDPSLFTWPYDSALALALRAAGHDVKIFGRPPRHLEETGAALELLVPHFYKSSAWPVLARVPQRLGLGWKALTHVAGMARLLRELRTLRPDVIHFQWSPVPLVDRHFVTALSRISRTVLTVHDSTPGNGTPRAGARLAESVATMRAFDRIIVHTEAARLRLLEYGIPAARIRVVAHGMLDRYPLDVTESPRRPGDEVEVLMFGYLKPYKGIDVLLSAAAEMSPEALAGVRIRIVGKPLMEVAPLRKMIADLGLTGHVELDPRFVPDDEVGRLFARADIVALPYREIDASGVLMTAITAGVPVVGSRLGLVAELLEDQEHGRLVQPGDHVALARALEELVGSRSLLRQMSRNVSDLHTRIPTWDVIAAQTGSIYEELLSLTPRQRQRRGSPARRRRRSPTTASDGGTVEAPPSDREPPAA